MRSYAVAWVTKDGELLGVRTFSKPEYAIAFAQGLKAGNPTLIVKTEDESGVLIRV